MDIFNSYRVFLNQNSKKNITNDTFIETIKPFLTFYRGLPEYSKNTKRLKPETIAIREAIANSKDPEQSFFEGFPAALGYSTDKIVKSKSDLRSYINKLQDSIRELRTCIDSLTNRFESFITAEFFGKELSFEEYKNKLQGRFEKLRTHLLLPYQKTFVLRLNSALDDKKSWLNSLAQAVIGKTLDIIKDEEEILLYDKFKSLILELDSLTMISNADLDEENEEVFGLEINSFVEGVSKKLVRLPKSKKNEINAIEIKVRKMLSKDKTMNIAALASILKDLLKI